MPFAIQGKVDGLQTLLARLKELDKKVRKKTVRKAVTKAGRIILKDAKRRVRKQTGLLRKSLGQKVKVYPDGNAVAIIGPRLGFRQEVERDGRTVLSNPVKYAHLVELGTQHSPAYPFLASALHGTRSAVTAAMADVFREALEGGGA